MPPRARRFVATLAVVFFLAFWVWGAVTLHDHLPNAWWIDLIFFAVAGIGFIINLEARGGGGRAAMFETGRGDGPTIRAFAPVAMKADGGVTATPLETM